MLSGPGPCWPPSAMRCRSSWPTPRGRAARTGTARISRDADIADPAQSLTQEGMDDAIADSLRERLAALERAEQRLADGTYGRSVLSGQPIPDERLEAYPAAELTVEEAAAREAAGR